MLLNFLDNFCHLKFIVIENMRIKSAKKYVYFPQVISEIEILYSKTSLELVGIYRTELNSP